MVANYVAALRAIAEYCDFADSLEAMIQDRLICSINNVRIQCRLLQESSLTYESAFEKAQAMELAVQGMSHMTDSKPAPVYNMHNKSGTGKHSTNSSHPARVECCRCGGNHYATICRFMEATCRTCGKKGHLARVCRSSAKGSFQTSKKPQTGKSSLPQSTNNPNPNSKPQFPTHSLHEEPHLLAPCFSCFRLPIVYISF